jgi:hypothetical protein
MGEWDSLNSVSVNLDDFLPKQWEKQIKKDLQKGIAAKVAAEVLKKIDTKEIVKQLDLREIASEAMRIAVEQVAASLNQRIQDAISDGIAQLRYDY